MTTVNPGFTFHRNASVNPLLANPGGFTALDSKLQQTSPCIDACGTPSGVTEDYCGTTRAGAFDIGAHDSAPAAAGRRSGM